MLRIDWGSVGLGRVPDEEIAAKLGVTRQAVVYARKKRSYNRHSHDVLAEIIFEHTPSRRCITPMELYDEVLNDYGSIHRRAFQRAVAKQLAERKLARIAADRTSMFCGYVRYGSPLLWEPGGYAKLVDSLEWELEHAWA